jgi:Flp pilus assembly pilin Flp
VYKNISGTWTQQGATLTGEATDDYFGYSVSISASGDTIVVGASGANSLTGYAKVYKNISGTWTQQGATLTGEANIDRFGISVSISASGDTIVVGAHTAVVGGNIFTGYAKVYKNISGTWTRQGAKITGETDSDLFGKSVSISASGDTIVVGEHYNNSQRGYAKVYK